MKNRPELMILIAVIVALVASIVCSVATCSAMTTALSGLAQHSTLPSDDWLYDHINGGDGNGGDTGNGNEGNGDDTGNGDYTEKDVPASMEIETDELTDDLQAVINSDITRKLGLGDSDKITASNLTKDTVATPELKNGRVLSQVSGKVTITNMLGMDEVVDYTSYYYADDPRAEKITWYIYAYDLGSYDVLPSGLQDVAGDPMDVRELIQGGTPSLDGLLGMDGKDA